MRGGALSAYLKRVDDYWFGHGSPTTIGIFRILISSLCFVNFAMIAVDFSAWFSQRGFVPQAIASRYQGSVPLVFNFLGINVDFHNLNVPRLNLLSNVYDDRVTLAFYIGVMVFAVLSALGLWTRLSTILMAVGVVTLHHRNSIILHGGDTVLRIGCLYAALAPSGAACSLDRVIGIWKGRISAEPVRVSLWPQRLMSFNLALVYFTTFWHKFGFGNHWRDLTATWYPARLNEFHRFPVPGFLNELPFIYFSTLFTLATELSLGTLVFYRPLRKYVLFAGLMLHAFIEYSMNIPLFSFLIACFYITFYEGEEIETWAKRWGQRLLRYKATIFLPAGTALDPGKGAALAAMDPLGLVRYETGKSATWEAKSLGKPIKPFRASLSRSLGAWVIGAVPYLWRRLLSNALVTAPTRPAEMAEVQSRAKSAKKRR